MTLFTNCSRKMSVLGSGTLLSEADQRIGKIRRQEEDLNSCVNKSYP